VQAPDKMPRYTSQKTSTYASHDAITALHSVSKTPLSPAQNDSQV